MIPAHALLTWLLSALGVVTLIYFITLNSTNLLFCVVAFFRLLRHRRRWTARTLDAVVRSPATPGVSIVVPAHNEEAMIVQSVRALQLVNYPQYEIIVVNDGSVDRTLTALIEAFGLMRAPVSHQHALPTRPVVGCYQSLTNAGLVVLDKQNGGKSDAINAGINAARHQLVCVIDADSLLEEHSLARAVLPFLEDPDTIAAGGIIRVVNGCIVDDARVTEVRLPRNPLAMFQVVEYLRAFLAARVALSWLNGLLIISGAFGIFRRAALIEAGGFRVDAVGEDMEIVTRLHRLYRDSGRRYRIVFQPDPVCWTEVPESLRVLSSQRNRWQRGTLQVLGYQRAMFANLRYGAVGGFAIPYYGIFEGVGALFEIFGYGITVVAILFGVLDWRFAQLLFFAVVAYGSLTSLMAIVLEELTFRRYPRTTDLLRLTLFGMLENFGYRQIVTWWRARGAIDYFRNKQGWGVMTRKGSSAVFAVK